MPLNVADRVRETTTTTGTGTITLTGAVAGYQSFAAVGNGNTTYYTINAGSQWEVGIGTYLGAGPTLSRDTVLESSNSNALVDFAAGVKDVFITYPAEKSVYQDGSTINAGSAVLGIANGGTSATTAGGALTALGAYPASNPNGYTSNTGTVTSVDLTAGTGVSVSGGPITTSGAITVTNTAPDQIVSLTGAGTTSVTGTYPNFTITSNDSKVGDVVGPASATDNAIARFNATTGKLIQNSGVTIDDSAVVSAAAAVLSNFGSATTAALGLGDGNTGLFRPAANTFGVTTGGVERARIDASGNLGLGVTPSAWISAYRALEVGNHAALYGRTDIAVEAAITANTYRDAGGTWRYKTTNIAGVFGYDTVGQYYWNTAPSGTAGAAIGFTQAMTLDASGNLAVGTTTAASTSGKNLTIGGIEPSMVLNATGGRSFSIASGNNYQYTGNTLSFIDNTAGATRMLIDASGNVGIGTSSPSTFGKLAIGPNASTGTENQIVAVAGTGGVFNSVLRLGAYAPNGALGCSIAASVNYAANAATSLIFSTTPSGAATSDLPTERMRIDASGNVGIGTSSPASPLDVVTNSSALGIAIRGRASDNVGALALRSNDGATIYGQVQGRSTDFRLEAGSSNIISAYTNNAERMRVHASGGVSIGNTVDTGASSLNISGNLVIQDRVYTEMMAPTTKAAAATLTGAEVMGQYIQYTGGAATLTLPTATNLQAAMPTEVATLNDISFDFTIINTGSGTCTLAVNTGITAIGALTTAAGTSTTFRIRKTATNTFIIYRT